MKKLLSLTRYLLFATLLGVASCGDDKDPAADGIGQFVIMSATEKWDAGYITAYSEFPSGTTEKLNNNSLQINNAFGFRSYKKWFFNRSNAGGDEGLQKYSIDDNGGIKNEGFIPGASQYLVVDDTHGYYLDETRGTLKLQTFNPTAMQRTGEIDLSSLKDDEVEYQAIGKHTLAAKDGKLYAGIVYGTLEAQGYEGNVYDYVEFAVIDMASNTLDKTIKWEGLRSIGWGSSGNKMWSIGDDGALYLCATGLGTGFDKSSIIRIKKNETDFDKDFHIKATDYAGPSSIAITLVKNGKLYLELSNTPMNDDFSNLQDIIMEYYSIDLTSKAATKITGLPLHHYAYANDQAITEIDGQVYFWVRNPDQKIDGYYSLNADGVSTTQVFNLNHDGFMWGFVKLEE